MSRRVRRWCFVMLAAVLAIGSGCARTSSPIPSGSAAATPPVSATTATSSEASVTTAAAPGASRVATAAASAVPGRSPIGDAGALRDLVRDDLQGFEARPVVDGPFSLTRAYVPDDRSRADALVVSVERYRDRSSAEKRIADFVERRFPREGARVSAAGLKGYFGTSGRSAVLALDDAGILLMLEAHASGVAPSALKADLISVAESLLD